jgi:hypothetical protein
MPKAFAAFTGRPLSNSDMPASYTRWRVATTCSACRMALTLKWAEAFFAIYARDSDETVGLALRQAGPFKPSFYCCGGQKVSAGNQSLLSQCSIGQQNTWSCAVVFREILQCEVNVQSFSHCVCHVWEEWSRDTHACRFSRMMFFLIASGKVRKLGRVRR